MAVHSSISTLNSPLVLLMEDDLPLLDLNKRALTRAGYRALTARSAREARENAAKDPPQGDTLW